MKQPVKTIEVRSDGVYVSHKRGYTRLITKNEIDTKRFESTIMPIPYSGCWEWIGSFYNNGYGMFIIKSNSVRAHRVSYTLYKNEIPFGLHCLHTCDNPSCVNPDHLFLGTHQQNMKDKVMKGRNNDGDRNGRHILLKEYVLKIRERLKSESVKEIAKEYGVSPLTIRNIKNGISWKNI